MWGEGPLCPQRGPSPRHIMQQYTVIACLFFGREAFFHKRLPSPNLSLPKNFTGSLAGQFGPARRRVAAMSPGGMTNRRLDGNSRPICLVVQVLAGLWASVALQVTTAEVWTSKVFGGMGGVGGRAPLSTKGPFPPTYHATIYRYCVLIFREGSLFSQKASLSEPLPSQKLYRVTGRTIRPGKTPRGCHVPRRDDKQEAGRQ